jgi:RimJ/RimL family protein N-acetyltransferase
VALTLPIRTERMLLRRFELTDRAAFLRYRRHPDVARHQSWDADYSDVDADGFLAEMTTAEVWRPGHWFQIALEHDGTLIGDVAFRPDPARPEAEIGYSLHPDNHGRGFASEAVRALVAWLGERGMTAVVAGCDIENASSARLLERVGFSFVGIESGERLYRVAIDGVSTLGP